MTPGLEAALAAVRTGRVADAHAAHAALGVTERRRLALALAHQRGDGVAAVARASELWHLLAVDPTVAAALVGYRHPRLARPAAVLLDRMTRDAARDLAPAHAALAADPGALGAWRDVLGTLLATGRDLEAVDGVALALGAGAADLALWVVLVTALLDYRHGHGLVEAVALGRAAFGDRPEVVATAALVHLGCGDLAAATAALAAIPAGDPFVDAAAAAVAAAAATAWSALA